MSAAEELRELAQRGVGFDMNPTMMFTTAESMYSQWLEYFARLDQAWRERVTAAADALSTPPAEDVRGALDAILRANNGYWPQTRDDILATFEVRPRGTVTNAEVQCPHWSPGSITIRSGCTGCEALSTPPADDLIVDSANRVAMSTDMTILQALSTPPADDVREALDHLDALNESGRIQYAEYVALHDMVSRIEVRPRGTVTSPGVDLVEVISTALIEWRNAPVDLSTPHSPSLAEYVADAVWRAQGHHDSPETVTDAEVEVAARAYDATVAPPVMCSRIAMRAALEAAREARSNV